jgi:hypothetical protein
MKILLSTVGILLSVLLIILLINQLTNGAMWDFISLIGRIFAKAMKDGTELLKDF